MRFNNSFELATYFVEKCTDGRKWGELEGFQRSQSWRYWFWDMCDKYYRGKPPMTPYTSPEYKEAKFKMMSNFIDYIDMRLTFPLDYTCECTYADGYSACFKVAYTTDNQLSFDMTMI